MESNIRKQNDRLQFILFSFFIFISFSIILSFSIFKTLGLGLEESVTFDGMVTTLIMELEKNK